MFKIVAFDLDGTIADTIPMCIKAFRDSVSPYTDHELLEEEILQTFGLNEIGMIKTVVHQDWKSALEDFYACYELLHNKVTDTFPGITELLHYLKSKNIVTALITGKGRKSCTITLEKLGLTQIFDEILVGSELSPNKKENMNKLLKKYAVSKEELGYIGDTVRDIKDCREVGIVCFSAAWQKFNQADKLEEENPNHVFYCVNDLYHYINKM